MEEPTQEDFEKVFGKPDPEEIDGTDSDIIIDSNVYINMYYNQKTLTKKEVMKQMAIWMNSILINEHI